MIPFLFLATCFLAYSNGANDNFKGVASLFGSRTCSYKTAISWATITTGAISLGPNHNAGMKRIEEFPVRENERDDPGLAFSVQF